MIKRENESPIIVLKFHSKRKKNIELRIRIIAKCQLKYSLPIHSPEIKKKVRKANGTL